VQGVYALKFELISFDLEGTVVDFQWNLDQAVEKSLEALERKKVSQDIFTDRHYASIYNLMQKKQEEWGYADNSLTAVLDEIYDEFDLDAASRWKPAEGLYEALQELSGCKKALVTNIGRKGVDRALDQLDIEGEFDIIITRNDVRMLKPEPEGLNKALSWAGVKRERAVHVGDSFSDLFAARGAGIRIVILLGGENSSQELLGESPGDVIKSLSELPPLLAGMR